MREGKSWWQRLTESTGELVLPLLEEALWNDTLRGSVIRQLERYVLDGMEREASPSLPARVLEDRKDLVRALLESVKRALDRKVMSRKALHGALKVFNNVSFLQDAAGRDSTRRFAERHNGASPPGTLVVSPTRACNLNCHGCYANAVGEGNRLKAAVLERILKEAQELWSLRFITISGGEPFLYRDGNEDLLSILGRQRECYFLVYTNGMLIDERMAERLAVVGNITPAISVEGFAERTDRRRGEGAFDRILQAMAALRKAGIPFGISLTVTRENAAEVFSDAFLDFFFDEQMATYGWVFQYMPIGRHRSLELLPTPEQRVWMWKRIWEIIRNRKIMLADFWNCGTVTSGCISAAKPSGYLYIDWNGKIMPCVFVPYSPANIHEIYSRGGTLDDVYDLPYFRAIRRWQQEYAASGDPNGANGNWLLPCPLRDHYATAYELIQKYAPEPEDEAAAEALQDEAFRRGMIEYDSHLREAMDPIWEAEYLSAARTQSVAQARV